MLASTGSLGRPLEYFNGAGRRVFDDPDYPDDREAQLQAVLIRGATANGVFGVKLFSHQLDELAGVRWDEQLPRLRFIHLERADLLGQAISWVRADQSGRFRAYATGSGKKVHYDRRAISLRLNEIVTGNARWRAYFTRNGISPLLLSYEDIVADPQGAVRQVGEFLDETSPGQFHADNVDVEVQRDQLSLVWRERYLAEVQGPRTLPRVAVDAWSRLREQASRLLRRGQA